LPLGGSARIPGPVRRRTVTAPPNVTSVDRDAGTSSASWRSQGWTAPAFAGILFVSSLCGSGTGAPQVSTRAVALAGTGARSSSVEADATMRERELADRVRMLKLRSGFTWAQVAEMFGVSRRAVHLWVQGGNMSARHAVRLDQIQQVVAEHDVGLP